jgi:predicted metal-dependent peptidase
MSKRSPTLPRDVRAVEHAKRALRLVCATFPHLSGLAATIRLSADGRVPTAAVTPSGRVLVNPDWFNMLDMRSAAFVMAHELMHLCLGTHDRSRDYNHEMWNWAHDYIINDMLANELNCPVPAGGLEYPQARLLSGEQAFLMLASGKLPGPKQSRSDLSIELEEKGLVPPGSGRTAPLSDDVLDDDQERKLFPDSNPLEEEEVRRRVREAATKSTSLSVLKEHLDRKPGGGRGDEAGEEGAITEALRTRYQPPWQMALQQWMEAVAPGPRSYARPSRRGADRTDVVLAGRRREGWTLHIVLDTSGSMSGEIPRVLGTIASFCESVNVATIHVLQCDVRVTRDEFVTPEELYRFTIAGLGGSDMSPAMVKLAEDQEVEAVLVLTDGYISYPNYAMPYETLWVLMDPAAKGNFKPSYGQILALPPLTENE